MVPKICCCAEIGMGLLLIAGLFTWLASCLCIYGSEFHPFWYGWLGYTMVLLGAIALMAGAGKALGLDYFVMPWLKKLFSNFWVGKPKPIYDK